MDSILHKSESTRHGLSLVEVAVSTLLIGLVLIGAMETIGAALRTTYIATEDGDAHRLAEDLMEEILTLPYEDPDGSPVLGIESSEPSINSDRSAFDDIDDYNGWSSNPPEDAAGNPLPGRTGWARSVTVQF